MPYRSRKLGTTDYQRTIIEEFKRYGGSSRTATNMCRTINKTYRLVDSLPAEKEKLTVLRAVLAERKKAIEDHPHMTTGLRAIMLRYLCAVHAVHIKKAEKEL